MQISRRMRRTVAFVAFVAAGCSGAPEPPRPNFVIVLTDDQAYSTLPFMQHTQKLLVEEGTSFTNFFINDPICCPARGTIFLGEYHHNHLLETHPKGCSYRFFEEGKHLRSMGKLLQNAGYRTSYIGKPLNSYHLYLEQAGPDDSGDHLLDGWSEYHAIVNRSYYGFKLHENGAIRSIPADRARYQTDVLSRIGQDFIEASSEAAEPFLLFISPDAPHAPSKPAIRHRNKFPNRRAPRVPSFNEADVSGQPALEQSPLMGFGKIMKADTNYRLQLQSLLAVDEMVRDLVAKLSETQQLEDTYFFFLSDNGLHFGEHRIVWGKGTPFEESVRVPLVVRGPGVERGAEISRLTNNADLLPTLLDLVGETPGERVDGRSLAPLFGPDAKEKPWRNAIVLESRHEVRNQGVPPFGAVRTEHFKWIEFENGRNALYDLRNDPHELTNVAGGTYRAVAGELSQRLAELLACSGAACRAAEDAPLEARPTGE
jgi:arylsulfatase A-like enzyme